MFNYIFSKLLVLKLPLFAIILAWIPLQWIGTLLPEAEILTDYISISLLVIYLIVYLQVAPNMLQSYSQGKSGKDGLKDGWKAITKAWPCNLFTQKKD